jgi:hypothetical protein
MLDGEPSGYENGVQLEHVHFAEWAPKPLKYRGLFEQMRTAFQQSFMFRPATNIEPGAGILEPDN